MKLKILFLMISLHFPIANANGASSEWQREEQVAVRLVSAFTSTGSATTVPLGLQFKLKPGWKIYWRSPGDAGLPPKVTWGSSENVKDLIIGWPAPKRFSVLGLETLGYLDEVLLPVELKLKSPGATNVRAQLEYLICEKICIPYVNNLELSLPAGRAVLSDYSNLITQYMARIPKRDGRHGLSIESARLTKSGDENEIIFVAQTINVFTQPDIYVEGPAGSHFGKPEVFISQDRKLAELRVLASGVGRSTLEQDGITATLVDGDRSIEAKLYPKYEPSNMKAPLRFSQNKELTLAAIIILALLGGLILNIMPCVLPVLSIKLLGVISNLGKDSKTIRAGFLASAAGILFSFMTLGVGLIVLKAGGASVGWGIQFQQPVFLAFLSIVLGLFAYNLFGFFEVKLPAWVGSIAATRLNRDNLAEHFFAGTLAALVATPCSAPFLGTAVGFALSQGWFEILLVFSSLGVGLASPYLLVALFPGLAGFLPRPGPWMNTVKRVLGVALLATVVWLLYVFSNILDVGGAALLGGLIVTMGVILLLKKLSGSALGRSLGFIVLFMSVAAIIFPTMWNTGLKPIGDRPHFSTAVWREFDAAQIKNLVADGQTVLVDVTADWCVTCQVNKRFVLDTSRVVEALKTGSIIGMRADWTMPNDEIAKYLGSFGHFGIPFNVVYGPEKPDGIVLPELLTNAVLARVFNEVSGMQGATQ